MKYGIFVTGTDTGVGKTLISAALVHGGTTLGLRAAGIKPVAAGCRLEQGRLISQDVELLQAAANVSLVPSLVNPYAFEPPLSPHIAAERAGVRITLATIKEAVDQAQGAIDLLVVEGVGGFRVPLSPLEDTADLAQLLGLPVLLVVGMRLGCLNHALLTAEAIAARGLPLAGWVGNCIDPHMAALDENVRALEAMLQVPCLGLVPYLAPPDYRVAARSLACETLLGRIGA
jgi:dethiobiotin synthetase